MMEIVLTSSALILLLVILRRALRGRIRPCVQYALWLLAAARLLVPGTLFTAPVSVLGAADGLQTTLHQTFPGPDNLPEPVISSIPDQLPQAAAPDGDVVASYPQANPAATRRQVYNWPDTIWKTGIVIVGGAMVVSNLVFCLRLRKERKRLALPAAWSGRLPVYETEGLPSPCLFGFFRPAIYLNEAAMDAEHPEHILAHEYAHYRHGDHVWAVLRCVCVAVHWYNPLVWWAAALSRRDCELACDEAALGRLGDEARIDYGHTLLGMVSQGRSPSALLRTATTMTAGKRAMKERIALIIKQPKMRKVTMVLVALAVCGAVAVTFGGKAVAAEPEPDMPSDPAPAEDAMPAPSSDPVPTGEAMLENARSIVKQVQSGADVGEWLPLLNYMDWGLLRQAAVEAGMDEGDGSGAAVELLSAIDRYAERQGGSMTMAEYLCVLSATAGLDGAVSEGYAYTIHRMYIMNPSRFAYVVLEQLPEERRDAAMDLFCSEWYYDQASSWDLPTREEATAQLEADLAAYIFASPSEMTLRGAGSTFQLQLLNAPGIYALTYASSDTSVAEVDGSGVVTAVGPGEAVISAHYEGAGGPLDFTCRVRCEWEDTDTAGFRVREDGARIKEDGSEVVFTAYQQGWQFYRSEWERGSTVTFSSSDLAVATVDPEGLVYSEGPGEAVITAHYLDSNGPREYTCLIHSDWDDTVSLGVDDADYRLHKETFELYGDEIAAWQKRYEDYVANTLSAPATSITYKDPSEIEHAVAAYLQDYYDDYFNTFFAQDPFVVGVDGDVLMPYMELSDFDHGVGTVDYALRIVPVVALPNGYRLSGTIQVKYGLTTTLSVDRELSAGGPTVDDYNNAAMLSPSVITGRENWNLEYIAQDIRTRVMEQMEPVLADGGMRASVSDVTKDYYFPENLEPGDTLEIPYHVLMSRATGDTFGKYAFQCSASYTFVE